MSARFVGVRITEVHGTPAVAGGMHDPVDGRRTAALVLTASPDRSWAAVIDDTDASPWYGTETARATALGTDPHLRVEAGSPAFSRWSGLADVLVATAARTPDQARRRAETLLVEYPGCLVTVVPLLGRAGCVLGTASSGRAGTIVMDAASAPPSVWPILGSFLHGWLSAGRHSGELLGTTLLVHGPDGGRLVTAR
ncbi:hypothetical protein [Streptomyces sp. NPDC049881]|uniref:hypothetical protein n=1 Tax=Streptomyces sp. NPDC049881 TaxID=3155778 RepID=UPI00341D1F92